MKGTSHKEALTRVQWVILLPIIVLSTLPLFSCVTNEEMVYMNDQISDLNKRVTNLQGSQNAMNSRLDRQADLFVEIDGLKGEIQRLSGRVEENEHIIKRTVERDLGEQDTMQATLALLSQKVTELEAMVRHQYKYLGLEPPPVPEGQGKPMAAVEPKEKPVPVPKVEPKEKPPPPKVVPKDEPKPKQMDLYDRSLASFREGRVEEAMEGFKGYLEVHPKSDRSDNAQFWIGECHMALGQYEQAILAFQEVIKKYPKGNKVPNAMLRQAMAFLELKDKTSSRLLLRKIIKEYPKSNEAKIARKKLTTI